MTTPDPGRDDRLLDLLAARATEGVSPREAEELAFLLKGRPDVDPDAFDLAAAAADLELAREHGDDLDAPLPPALRAKLLAQAPAAPIAPARGLPWGWIAAAAVLVAAVGISVLRESPAPPSLDRLVREASDVTTVAWARSEQPGFEGVTGEVVWSTARQEGYLRLRGIPVNDPAEKQYQLWIVDPARDKEPIDGGVFDVPSSAGEVVVPIRAKLPVVDPKAFALTLEQPGGVVVSEGPLLLVAPLKG
ncbi:MAG TPA: anti-sigma factor [Candidatus Polarisedimenticolaceae bacterium]